MGLPKRRRAVSIYGVELGVSGRWCAPAAPYLIVRLVSCNRRVTEGMCGIAGVFHGCEADQAVGLLLETATYLQHRGQDACGIATATQDGHSYRYKGLGLVSQVFQDPQNILGLVGHMGLLHRMFPFIVI